MYTLSCALVVILFVNKCLCGATSCKAPENVPCRNNSNSCEYICKNDSCEIRAIVILPNSTELIASLPETLRQATEHIRNKGILPSFVNITLDPWDDKCEPSYAQIATMDAYTEGKCIHVILGPICDYCLATISRILKFLGTPLLTSGGFSQDFEKPKIACTDEYFMMMRTGVIYYKGLAKFIHMLLKEYEWKKLMFLYDKNGKYEVAGQSTCSLVMQTIVGELKQLKGFEYEDGDMGLSTLSVDEFLKSKIGTDFGITVMCASKDRTRDILLAAEALDQMVYNGEYLFINIDLTNNATYPDRPWIDESNDIETAIRLEHAYNSVITLTLETEETVDERSGENVLRNKSNITSGFYDALLLYAHALSPFVDNTSAKANENKTISSFDIVAQMWGKTFAGLNGDVKINCNGDRLNTYSLLSLNKESRRFEPVATYKENDTYFEFIKGRRIYWPSGLDKPPKDVPICGFDKSKCPDTSLPGYAILSITAVVVAVAVVIVVYLLYKKNKLNAEISSMIWKIYWEDIQRVHGQNLDGFDISNKKGSQLSLYSEYSISAERQIYIPTGFYKKTKVAIKRLPFLQKIDLKRSQLIELKQMKDLSHDHLVKFYGACLEPPNCCLLIEYCAKGSLQDILENEQFKMDEMISISLLQDIIRGMLYLHHSEIRSHGSLTSSNCVVDSRLVVKITDFGLHFLKSVEHIDTDSHEFWKKKLWTAPELLRLSPFPPGGTQKGDVYSFGIIMHEVIFRKGSFYLGEPTDEPTEPREIVKNVSDEWRQPHFRPCIEQDEINLIHYHHKDYISLMQKCWNEQESERPDFNEIKNKIRKFNKGSEKGNILDNLLSRMEQYANNLEYLVEERTSAYLEEKKKFEELLYQLLPKSVASQLIANQPVVAESYDEVTVYFSDIVGFTSLSAASTPLQVVNLLNDLYTCFDSIVENFDVYKVETIGDAYMVVSGLPVRNGNAHAPEIARLSLALLARVRQFKIHHRPEDQLRLRIGIHSGPCVAGVVGLKMPRYCLFGDTVNTASRMESNGQPLRIHVSPVTKQLLDQFQTFHLECRGEIEMKNGVPNNRALQFENLLE